MSCRISIFPTPFEHRHILSLLFYKGRWEGLWSKINKRVRKYRQISLWGDLHVVENTSGQVNLWEFKFTFYFWFSIVQCRLVSLEIIFLDDRNPLECPTNLENSLFFKLMRFISENSILTKILKIYKNKFFRQIDLNFSKIS